MDLQELNLNEMEDVTGGKGGSKKLLPQKDGYVVYQIERGDTLLKIASWYGTTVKAIKNANPTITNANDITAGYYIYVPVK